MKRTIMVLVLKLIDDKPKSYRLGSKENDKRFYEKLGIIDTKIRLNKLIALNLQLYQAIVDYTHRYNIHLPLDFKIISLLSEIEEITFKSRKLPRIFFDDGNPDKLPEPISSTFLSLVL